MIMAIEAACQKVDPAREIEGYELRDILIGKAILIPQDDPGVETMISFKPWRSGSQALSFEWQEFNLFSRQEDWELNCTGLISIKYKHDLNPLFEDEESAANKKYSQKYREVRDECTKKQNPRLFYEHLTTIGLHYGDIFQNLIEIQKGEFMGECTLKVPDTKSLMPHGFEYPHVIHPTTLDSIIQMALPTCSSTNEDITVAMVPTSIKRLYVSADCPSTPGTLLHGYAAAENAGSEEIEATVVVSNAEWNKPFVIFEGINSTSMSGPAEGTSASLVSMRKLTSYFQWREDVSKLDVEDVKTMCARHIQDIGQVDLSIYQDLELACFIYMKRVLNSCSPEEAKTFAPHFQLLYQFMQDTYEKAKLGKAVHQSDKIDWLNTSPEFESELLYRVSKNSNDGAGKFFISS